MAPPHTVTPLAMVPQALTGRKKPLIDRPGPYGLDGDS